MNLKMLTVAATIAAGTVALAPTVQAEEWPPLQQDCLSLGSFYLPPISLYVIVGDEIDADLAQMYADGAEAAREIEWQTPEGRQVGREFSRLYTLYAHVKRFSLTLLDMEGQIFNGENTNYVWDACSVG